jgi:hypothetical protein
MRRRAVLTFTLMLLACALPGAVTAASASDVSSTHSYIRANYALAKAGVAHIAAAQAKVAALNASLAQSCPNAGQGAPELEVTQPLSGEVVVALWSLAYGVNAGPINSFFAASSHWHWSNGKITRIAKRYARSQHEMATLPLPDLCKDVRAFTASGFTKAPPGVEALVDHANSIQLEPVPKKLLAPYERGSDRSVLAKTARLELKLEGNEFALGQTDWLEVLGTLGLPQ